SAKRAGGSAGINDISGGNGRTRAANSRKEWVALPYRRGPGRRQCRLRFLARVFSGARISRQQAVWFGANTKGRRWRESAERARGTVALRAGGGASRSSKLYTRGGNGQVTGKHLSVREHRAG